MMHLYEITLRHNEDHFSYIDASKASLYHVDMLSSDEMSTLDVLHVDPHAQTSTITIKTEMTQEKFATSFGRTTVTNDGYALELVAIHGGPIMALAE